MKIRMIAASLLVGSLFTGAALAGSFQSKVVAHDRVAKRIVLEDKSVVSYDKNTQMPSELNAGDSVEVQFTGGEGAMDKIVAITVLDAAQ